MTLDVLRAAQQAAGTQAEPGLPLNRLRFTLEYAETPDASAERTRISALVSGNNFSLELLDELLPEFLILQFPGVERRVSPESQFSAADTLVDSLGLVSAVPDVGSTYITAPDDPSRTEGIGDLFLGLTCWVKEDPLTPDWAVKSIRADRVWARGIKGNGVVIAQPDSGVAQHSELTGVLDLSKAANTLDGTNDPTDPLSSSMGNPGHGTATASVVASRQSGLVFGSAPAAKVVPIRCLDNVVLGLDPTPVARAILHAVRINADVISMSLGGGLFSPAMSRALEVAAKAGIIIVSAAGNCVQPIVVYPARDRNVVGLAGTNHLDKPWKGTSRGANVSVSAPAENVTVARRTPDDNGVEANKPSQGTSFATALTAGVAALWIERFGRSHLKQQAQRLGLTVNQLFRFAVRHTARKPASWPKGMGTGIVNAEALIDFDPKNIASIAAPETTETQADAPLVAALDEAFEGIETGFDDWPRIGAETIYLLNDAWLREERSAGIPVESTFRPKASSGTSTRMPEDIKSRLESRDDSHGFLAPIATGVAERSPARHIAAGAPTSAESSRALTESAALDRLRGDQANAVIERADRTFRALESRGLGDRNAQAEVMQNARSAIETLATGDPSSLDTSQRVVLEALVRLTDRPAYRVQNGSIDPNDPLYGEWGGFLDLIIDLPSWTRSVGRINMDGTHIGTGFVMGGGQIMTNRHVLEACADEFFGPSGQRWQMERGAVTIDFSDAGDGSLELPIKAVNMAGPNPINGLENLQNLDAAILALEDPANAPPALPFARNFDDQADMVIVGFPARPGTSAFIDPATGEPNIEIARRLREIFGTDYGRKYVAPGATIDGPGEIADDTKNWIASHDCTTLGGNSGSVLIQFNSQPAVAGLHFSGAPMTANKAHALGRVDAQASIELPGAIWI